ncbi:MAG: hypothetical protein CMO06_04015 [Thalassospira sp.]|uniref:Abi-alpha family protein n=1 Tax=Thalassospira sp. TaxID=1912094 RepID=UPI000C4093AE|nr:Abi-alpha family protein [Thalassospira sp.]MAZ32299.1 hypothetical protein [Thalassospira sp.]|tara:strand:- start:281 stop:991 length:711 start_codon:yes stop_codon:yes gene_type:complete
MSIEEEIIRSLPTQEIYQDVAKPSAKQAGKFLEDVSKVLRLATAPIQLGAALQDKFENFINKSVRSVPDERFVAPPPQIVGPVLEGVRYEPEDTPIYEMFSNLLSNSMDTKHVARGHPAYPGLIRQLSSDEAIILNLLAENSNFYRTLDLELKTVNGEQRFVSRKVIEDNFPVGKIALPERMNFYVDHLHTLGLAGMFRTSAKPVFSGGKQTASIEKSEYKLTSLGEDFVAACQRK